MNQRSKTLAMIKLKIACRANPKNRHLQKELKACGNVLKRMVIIHGLFKSRSSPEIRAAKRKMKKLFKEVKGKDLNRISTYQQSIKSEVTFI